MLNSVLLNPGVSGTSSGMSFWQAVAFQTRVLLAASDC